MSWNCIKRLDFVIGNEVTLSSFTPFRMAVDLTRIYCFLRTPLYITLKKALSLIFIQLISNIIVLSQVSADSLFMGLIKRDGKVETYYSSGSDQRAKYLQTLVEDAVSFFENKLNDTIDFKLLVLSQNDWNIYGSPPYPISSYEDEPDRIIIPARGFLRWKLKDNRKLYGNNQIYISDFIAYHELGHHISSVHAGGGIYWAGELFSNYIQIGLMHERIPEIRMRKWLRLIFTCLPFKYKSLEQFETVYSDMNIFNLVMFQVRFAALADIIYQEMGWNFMSEYFSLYHQARKQELSMPEANQMLIENLQSIDPKATKWFESMHTTLHPYTIPVILFIIILTAFFVARKLRNSEIINRNKFIIIAKVIMYVSIVLIVIHGMLFYAALKF